MKPNRYEVTEDVSTLAEGDVLDVTARYGSRHAVEMTLTLNSFDADPETVVVTRKEAGFSEREILSPTARIGDWHEYDLKFDAGAERVAAALESPGPARVTKESLRAIAKPVGEAV